MDRIIEVKVNGNYLFKDNKNAGVQYEANVTSLRIEFDAGWDGYAKKVTFWDAVGGNPVERTLATDLLEDITKSTRIYLCPIPGEPLLIAGNMTFVIDGYVGGKRQRSISDKLRVKEAPFKETAGEPADPTPTQAEQLQVQIDGIKSTIQSAVQSADDARASAEAAKNSEIVAESAKDSAGTALAKAEVAQSAAEAARAGAEAARAGAEAARDQAEAIAGGDFATKTELAAHTGDSNIHVTAEEKAGWNERDVFIATYGTTTSADIEAAYQARKPIIAIYPGKVIQYHIFQRSSPTLHNFSTFETNGDVKTIQCSSDVWSEGQNAGVKPSTHASTHASGGTDPITPESIGAKAATDSDVFVATYGTTTLGELNAARVAGKHIVCKGINGENAALIAADTADFDEPASFFNFASFTPSCDGSMIYGCTTNGWSYTAVDFVPYAHAANHAAGGGDPITPASIGAAPAYTYGTEDLTAGTSELATGKLYFVFE